MKRKITAFIFVLCLVGALVVPLSEAAGNVCFTAINDTLQPLNVNTMPVIIGSQLYVPCDFFSSDELGVYYISGGSQVMLYNGYKKIIFDIEKDIVIGQGDGGQYISAEKRNGLIYVPVDTVCAFFGLAYDVIQSTPAPVVRFFNGRVQYAKDAFINMYKSKMQTYYDDYTGSSPEPGASPTIPSPPTYKDVSVYLGFYDLSGGELAGILRTLAATPYKAAFFVTAGDVEANAGLIRRAVCQGHTIGVRLTETTVDGADAEYRVALAYLFEAAQVRPVIVTALGVGAEAAETMAKGKSLVFWRQTKIYDGQAKQTVTGITAALSTLGGMRESLYFTCSDETLRSLRPFLTYLTENNYSVRRIVETSIPVMSA